MLPGRRGPRRVADSCCHPWIAQQTRDRIRERVRVISDHDVAALLDVESARAEFRGNDRLHEKMSALGIPRWKVILRVVVPTAGSGIFTAIPTPGAQPVGVES